MSRFLVAGSVRTKLSLYLEQIHRVGLSNFLSVTLILTGLVVGLLVANLVVDGDWQIALSLIFVLPALIVLHKHPFLAVLLWMSFSPFLLHTDTSVERRIYWVIHRSLPVLTVVIIFLSSALKIIRRDFPKPGIPEFLMLGYLVAGTLSIIYLNVEDPIATAYLFYDRVFIPMCLYLIVRLSFQQNRYLPWLIPIALYLALSQSIIGVISWFAAGVLPSDWVADTENRTTGSLVNTNVFSTTLFFSGLIAFHTTFFTKEKILRTLLMVAFLISVYNIFITFSRAAWLAGILIFIGLFYLYPKTIFKLSAVGIPLSLVLVGVIFSDQTDWAKQRLYSREAERSAVSRLAVNQAAYLMFQEKPIIGWGYGNFDVFDRRYQWRVEGFPANSKDLSSHNLYLTILAEQGISGILLYLGPMIWLLLLTIRNISAIPENGLWNRKLLIIFWLVILSHIVVNNFSNMKVVYGLGMWWITLGLIAHFIQGKQAKERFKN